MAANELEKPFFPSEYTKRFSSSPEACEKFVQFAEKVTAENSQKYNTRKDVKYGPGPKQLMDFYYKGEEKDTAIIVYIHGGYWKEFSKDQSAYCAEPLLENGCRLIVLGYDLCPAVSVADIIEQIRSAMKDIFSYAEKTSAKSVSVIGHSAGGCLVLQMINEALMSIPNINLLKGLYSAGGIYDLTGLENTSVNENNALSINSNNVKELSPMYQDFSCMKGKGVKLFILVGDYDSPMFITQAEDVNKHLQSFGLDSKYVLLKGYDHFDIVEDLAKIDYQFTQFVLQNI